jgi:hypothetical protein
MAARNEAGFDIGHPAPDRGRVALSLLMLGLFGAPAVWSLQLLLVYSFSSNGCLPGTAGYGWLEWLLPLVNLAALLLAGLAMLVAYRNLRRTGREHGGSGGVLDAGEGRTRFLSIWGIWMGVVFMLAIAFNTLAVFWGGLCHV